MNKKQNKKAKEQVTDYPRLISEGKNFIKTLNLDIEKVKNEHLVFIDYTALEKYSSDLASKMLDAPEEILQILESGIDNVIPNSYSRVRLINPPESIRVRIEDIRTKYINKLISIEGYLVQASDVRPQVIVAKFECPNCEKKISILQIEKKFREPQKCSCGRTERFILKSKELVDTQRIIVSQGRELMEGGYPKESSIAVFLQEDLTSPDKEIIWRLGTKIKVMGVLKEIPVLNDFGEVSTRFDLAIETNNIFFEEKEKEVKITEQDEKEILALAKDPEVFEKLAASVARGIWGYEEIKKALVLQLLGGTRGNINIMLIGDPKTGKSNLLRGISDLIPRTEYLDCVLMSDKEMYDRLYSRSFEGILPTKRFITINDINSLDFYEGKAHKLIKKRILEGASTLGSASPKLGRFEPFQTIAQQIDLHPELVNKFDLIFIIRDLPDKFKDSAVVNLMLGGALSPGESGIKQDLLRKYLVYAKIKANPKLNSEAIEEIREFYVKLRNQINSQSTSLIDAIPISARQIDTLAKLTEAHARLRLSNEANREDAKFAINIMKYFLMQVGYDPQTKKFDIDRITGVSAKQRKSIILVMNKLETLEEKIGKFIPLEELESVLKDKMNKGVLDDALQKLIASGDIFIPRKGFIQRI